jgi:hypothetical protein
MVFVNVHIHFRLWTLIRIRNPQFMVPDPAKVPDPCGSGSLRIWILIRTYNTVIDIAVIRLLFNYPGIRRHVTV